MYELSKEELVLLNVEVTMQQVSQLKVKAEQNGYTQVLWLDGVHRKYVEEVGTIECYVFN